MTTAVQNTSFEAIESRLNDALVQARTECNLDSHSPNCVTAWDTVEELQAEIAHRRQNKTMTAFEKYCDENPEAEECRIYDV
ncbi:MAG: hypothetical protein F6K09_04435 [Merismopedia sp. SIO2A8]|nr:hypothetical protein [Merismopedia sp. SIO2A8]